MSVHFGNVELNSIQIQRTSLNEHEAIAVWLLRWSGDKQHVIAAKLGTNPGRVADVLTGKTHYGSKRTAQRAQQTG